VAAQGGGEDGDVSDRREGSANMYVGQTMIVKMHQMDTIDFDDLADNQRRPNMEPTAQDSWTTWQKRRGCFPTSFYIKKCDHASRACLFYVLHDSNLRINITPFNIHKSLNLK
jgi:hypothetical protein